MSALDRVADGAGVVLTAAWLALQPPERLTVSEWADRHRTLTTKEGSEPGPWRTDRTPYLREIMDSLSVRSPIQRTVFAKASQIGASESGNNALGYRMHQAPCAILAVQPTVELSETFSKQRVASMIESCAELNGLLANRRAKDGGNTIHVKEFPGGLLRMVGAQSGAGLRQMPYAFLFGDELDAWPPTIPGEGDPLWLARRGLRTFSRRKEYLCSTPTIEKRSRIWKEFLATDQRHYWMPCPHCGVMGPLYWKREDGRGGIRWEKGDPKTAHFVCPHCEGRIEEILHKEAMLEAGAWVAHAPENANPQVVGYHLSSLYSPVGWYSWAEAVTDFLAAKDNPEELRYWVNTVLGMPFAESSEAPEWEELYRRREPYKIGVVPKGAGVLTVGVDIQGDRMELEVVAWGPRMESWSVEYQVIPGTAAGGEFWRHLDELLVRRWPRADGVGTLGISRLAIDTGHETSEVYRWARKHPTKVLPVKGRDKEPQIIGQPRKLGTTHKGKKMRRGVLLWPVGTDASKKELYGWLHLKSPIREGDEYPPGFCHFPEYGEEFFKQLCAHQLLATRDRRGFLKYRWDKVNHDRDEALDCRVYARAAAQVVGVDRMMHGAWTKTLGKAAQRASGPTTRRGTRWSRASGVERDRLRRR